MQEDYFLFSLNTKQYYRVIPNTLKYVNVNNCYNYIRCPQSTEKQALNDYMVT